MARKRHRNKSQSPEKPGAPADGPTIVSYSAKLEKASETAQPSLIAGSKLSAEQSVPTWSIWSILQKEFDLAPKLAKEPTQSVNRPSFKASTERLLNFVKVPLNLETFMCFGLAYCTAVFFKWLLVVPLRFAIHTALYVHYLAMKRFRGDKGPLKLGYSSAITLQNDLVTVLLTISTLLILTRLDSSKIYHTIKSGTSVKLYFMVGLLEISDKLLSAAGQDILRLVYGIEAVRSRKDGSFYVCKQNLPKFALAMLLNLLYLSLHAFVFVYQVMAMTVAVNSYSNALLTLILSSQFSEVKGAVFKRIEREGLFQVTCADLNERFLLLTILIIISSRNFYQVYVSGASAGLRPNSWYSDLTFSKTINDWIGLLIGPSYFVLGSELLVDWLKHSYMTRFNHIRPSMYQRFTTILARDYVADFRMGELEEVSDRCKGEGFPEILLRRTGIPIFTVMIIFVKMAIFPLLEYHLSPENNSWWAILLSLVTFSLVAGVAVLVRSYLAVYLLQWSDKILEHSDRPVETDYTRGNPNVKLADASDVREEFYAQNEKVPPSLESKRMEKAAATKEDELDKVVRFTMADKRIW